MNSVLTDLHRAVAEYLMPESAKKLIASGDLLILCGVTAAGKNTLANYLVKHDNFESVVSHTTRQPRSNHRVMEQNGREYWFVNPEQMLELVNNKAFVEIKAVHGETCYGTSIEAIERVIKAGKKAVMEIDIQGATELIASVPELRPVFVVPPSYDIWMERLEGRGEITEEQKKKRFLSARNEIEEALAHPSMEFVVNYEVDDTAQKLISGLVDKPEVQREAIAVAASLLESLE